MADVLLSSESLTVTGGPANISLDVNFGPEGQRGSLILYGLGKPSALNTADFPQTPQILDWYINLLTTDSEYLYLYQYVNRDGAQVWDRIFKVIPNVYNTNETVTFAGGQALLQIPVSNTTLALLPGTNIADINLNIHIDIENMLPVASSFMVTGLGIVNEDYTLSIALTGAELNPATGWGGIDGDRTAHISINVI
jgi:hypothetical protein